MFHKALFSAAFLLATTSMPAYALTATQIVEREVIVLNSDGTQTITRIAADKVTPGDKVIYSLQYFNDDTAPAENIVLVMPIPAEVNYIDASAEFDGVTSTYSTDGGKTYASRSDLLIKRADGNNVAAKASDITHVRWNVVSAILPNTGGTLSFSGRLQ